MLIYVISQEFSHDGRNLNRWTWYYSDQTTAWKEYVKLVKDFEKAHRDFLLAKDYNGDYCRDGEDYQYYEMEYNRATSLHKVKFTFSTHQLING